MEKRVEDVQALIRQIERAIQSQEDRHRKFKLDIIAPKNSCFLRLIELMQKFAWHGRLKSLTLRAMQLIIKIDVAVSAAQSRNSRGSVYDLQEATGLDLGLQCFYELAGETLAAEVLRDIEFIAETVQWRDEPVLACSAILLLAELGPQSLRPHLAPRIFDLLLLLPPSYMPDLVRVSLRMHAWGGESRRWLLETTSAHAGGRKIAQFFLDRLKRCDGTQALRAIHTLSGVVEAIGCESLLKTGDAWSFLSCVMRDSRCDQTEQLFAEYADSLTALCHWDSRGKDEGRKEEEGKAGEERDEEGKEFVDLEYGVARKLASSQCTFIPRDFPAGKLLFGTVFAEGTMLIDPPSKDVATHPCPENPCMPALPLEDQFGDDNGIEWSLVDTDCYADLESISPSCCVGSGTVRTSSPPGAGGHAVGSRSSPEEPFLEALLSSGIVIDFDDVALSSVAKKTQVASSNYAATVVPAPIHGVTDVLLQMQKGCLKKAVPSDQGAGEDKSCHFSESNVVVQRHRALIADDGHDDAECTSWDTQGCARQVSKRLGSNLSHGGHWGFR